MFNFTNQDTKAQKYQVGCVGQNSFIAYLSKQKIFLFYCQTFQWVNLAFRYTWIQRLKQCYKSSLYFSRYTPSALLSFSGLILMCILAQQQKMATIDLAITSTMKSPFLDLAWLTFPSMDLSLPCRGWLTGIDHSSFEPSVWQRRLEYVFYRLTKLACYQGERTFQRKMKAL